LVVALPRGGSPSTDLLVTSDTGGKTISLQVKTGTASKVSYKRDPNKDYWQWDTSYRSMALCDPHHWYAFVYLKGWPRSGLTPEVFFVPSPAVASIIQQQHDQGEKRPNFWISVSEADAYSGMAGVSGLLNALQ
jgi:hypothetical protein